MNSVHAHVYENKSADLMSLYIESIAAYSSLKWKCSSQQIAM